MKKKAEFQAAYMEASEYVDSQPESVRNSGQISSVNQALTEVQVAYVRLICTPQPESKGPRARFCVAFCATWGKSLPVDW